MKSIRNLEMSNHVSPEVVIDAFQAKLGRDEDVSVIQFQSDNKDVASDLVQFIESGHDYILDADYSLMMQLMKILIHYSKNQKPQ